MVHTPLRHIVAQKQKLTDTLISVTAVSLSLPYTHTHTPQSWGPSNQVGTSVFVVKLSPLQHRWNYCVFSPLCVITRSCHTAKQWVSGRIKWHQFKGFWFLSLLHANVCASGQMCSNIVSRADCVNDDEDEELSLKWRTGACEQLREGSSSIFCPCEGLFLPWAAGGVMCSADDADKTCGSKIWRATVWGKKKQWRRQLEQKKFDYYLKGWNCCYIIFLPLNTSITFSSPHVFIYLFITTSVSCSIKGPACRIKRNFYVE